MNKLIEEIFKNKQVQDINGNWIPLDSNIDMEEGVLIQSLISQNSNIVKSIEIGFAQGISALFITESLKGRENSHHTIIDPHQSTSWKGTGLMNLRKGGFESFTLIEKPSEIALPELLTNGESFDFALIDGWHTFDHTLVDFFYLEKMVSVGGIIGIDDTGMPGINQVVRYLLNYPNLKIIGIAEKPKSKKAKARDFFLHQVFGLSKFLFPKRYWHRIFSSILLNSNEKLGINGSMVFFEKIDIDSRPWNWYNPF